MQAARLCVLLWILSGGTVVAQHEYTASEVETGRQQYANQCARCHGPDGDTIANADIGKGKFRRATSDDQLVGLIRDGVPGTAMAAANNISEPNARAIVAYLRSMATTAAAVAALPPGDASRGKALFETKGQCMTCHRISDKGSRVGPDLTQIGASRRSVELHRSIMEPNAEVVPANRSFRAVTREGTTVTGRLLNQDTFTVQLLESQKEQLLSFQKANLREYGFVNTSPMPSFRDKLSSQELADIISYLTTLKGQAN
jgi:putative heme-binding domain-containing protein